MEDFRICLSCEYERGFHVSFHKRDDTEVSIRLICPNCGQSYDIGWQESPVKLFKPKKGTQY